MTRNATSRCALLLIRFAVCVFVLDGARGTTDAAPQTYDCGTLSLYHLLQLEGRPTSLEAVERCLRQTGSERQFSLAQLRDAARAFGLRLRGVTLSASDRAPDQAAIVYVDWQPHGHFLLVRPVGHTGTLVQVIDSTRAPYVIDAAGLYASPEWTGLALIPHRPNWPARFAGAMALASGVVLVWPKGLSPRRWFRFPSGVTDEPTSIGK